MQFAITAHKVTKAAVVAALFSSIPLVSSHLQADEKKNCLQAYDRAQTFRQDNKLVAAREQLKLCVRDVCPSMVRNDCTSWLAEVDQSMPSVVIEARRPDGGDAVDVTVAVDGQPFVRQIDGKAMPIDPGVHTFRFEMDGARPIEDKVVIVQGSKNRKISITFKGLSDETPAPDSSAKPATSAPPIHEAPEQVQTKTSPLAFVFGGLGVVGLGAFTYLGLKFDSKLNDMDKCSPNCPQSDADSASSTRTLALISGGVGVVSLGVATYLFLSPSKVESTPAVGSTTFGMLPTPGGAVGTLGGSF
jgi:hypothetical protein